MSASRTVAWAGVSQAGRIGLQVVTLIALSRLVPAQDFGAFALAGTITSLVFILRDMGTAAAVIQRKVVDDSLLSTVFWFNVVLGIGLGLIVALTAPWVARAFAEPAVAGLLVALAVGYPVASSGAVHQALLERQQRFKGLACIEVGAALVGLGAAVLAALADMGAYSLVVNQLTITVVNAVGLWMVSRWRPRWHWSQAEFRGIYGYSSHLFGSQLLNYFARNADSMLVGRFLGTQALGWYSMAYKLMLFPLYNLALVVGRASFPRLSQLQSDHGLVAQGYFRSIGLISLLTFPLMAGLFVLREPFVETTLGAAWMPVADILAWLCPVGLVQSITTTMGTIYMVTGRTKTMFRWGVFSTAVTLIGMAIGIADGYLGVARCYAVVNALLFLPTCHFALSQIDVSVWRLLKALLPQCLCALLMGAVLWWALPALVGGQPAWVRLMAGVSLGVATYAGLVVACMPDMRDLILHKLGRRGQPGGRA